MRNIWLIISTFVLLAVADWAVAGPVLTLSEDRIDFGRVPQNSAFYRKIVLRSEGDRTVRIENVKTYCPCILVPLETDTIPPGDSLVVEVSFFSATHVGNRLWRPHIYYNSRDGVVRFDLLCFVVEDVDGQYPIYVGPHTINASQFGDTRILQFPFEIINKSKSNIPLKLLHFDEEFFSLDFPVFIPPNDTASGKIVLNEKGVKSEFDKSITFEYIDEESEKKLYSIPVRRRIFKPGR